MAVKDSALPTADALTGAELVAIVQDALSKITTAEQIAAVLRGVANGTCPLDAGSKIPTMYLPALAVTTVSVVDSEAAQLALTAEMGDVAIRTDITTDAPNTYIHNGGTTGTMTDWTGMLSPTAPVQTVNGQTGIVNLDAADVGAVPDDAPGSANGVGSLDAAAQQPVTERRRKIVDIGDITGAVDIDLASADIIVARLVGNVTLTWVNLPSDGYVADPELRLTQDGTGGRTATWPADGAWPGESVYVLTTVAGKRDVIGFTVAHDGSWIGYPIEVVG